jgi:hypothetical protein
MLPPGYDDHRAVAAAQNRHRERHFSHIRSLRETEQHPGIVSRMLGRLASLRPAALRWPARTAEAHELTDYICRLPDGNMGRVAIRHSDGEWVAVCVRPA